jgi:hypothetical protein
METGKMIQQSIRMKQKQKPMDWSRTKAFKHNALINGKSLTQNLGIQQNHPSKL